ncbi:MAG TPA: MXAN_5187 C-terminal domain-containing protein [Pyrinomonadaceae bacterium]
MPIRDNKFARRARERQERNKKKQGVTEITVTIEEQLKRLEEDIRRLKIEFDVYFNGGTKRAPYDTKMRVEAHIKRLGDDRSLTFAQRFQYNSLGARYAAFRDMWRRTMQGREEGRDAGAAARASARANAVSSLERTSFICADGHKDLKTVKDLYEALVEAKRKCGEATEDLSFPRFHRLIAAKTDNLKEHLGCDRVLFSVDVDGGHVSFKAKADRE